MSKRRTLTLIAAPDDVPQIVKELAKVEGVSTELIPPREEQSIYDRSPRSEYQALAEAILQMGAPIAATALPLFIRSVRDIILARINHSSASLRMKRPDGSEISFTGPGITDRDREVLDDLLRSGLQEEAR